MKCLVYFCNTSMKKDISGHLSVRGDLYGC